MLRKVTVKIGLERINTQEGITVEVLLDSSVTELVISLKFSKRQGFKFKKIERPIYIRNIDRIFNKEGPIGLTGRQKKGRWWGVQKSVRSSRDQSRENWIGRKREKREREEEIERKRAEKEREKKEKIQEGKDNKDKENSRRMGDLE